MKPRIVLHRVGTELLWKCSLGNNIVVAKTIENAYFIWYHMEKLHDSKE